MGFRIKRSETAFVPSKATKPVKNKTYLAWLHELPCCVTGTYGVEAAHVSFANPKYGHYGRSKGTKASDRFSLPLSPAQHRLQHSMNEQEYWKSVGINPHVLSCVLFAAWSEKGDEATSTVKEIMRLYYANI